MRDWESQAILPPWQSEDQVVDLLLSLCKPQRDAGAL